MENDRGLSRSDVLAVGVAAVLVIAFAIWLISPRFSISGPSLVDDWSNLDNAPHALDELVRFSYDPAEVHDTRRYRPSYTAVWNSLQWRTFGAPDDMTGPNFWAVVRVALLVGGLVVLTAGAVSMTSRRRLRPAEFAAWAAVPALLLLATPVLVVDLARQGPSEPLMIGGMAVGAVLAVAGLRRILGRTSEDRAGKGIATAVLVLGFLLWLFGVYQKEASICALALLVPLYLVLDRRWRAHGIIDRPLHSYWAFRIVAIALVLPLVHMLYEISNVTEGGETVYGAEVPSGLSGWVTRLWDSAELQWGEAEVLLGTSLWRYVAIAAPLLLLAWIARYRTVPWLALGVIATAVGLYLFQGLAGVAVPRYYLPVVAILAVGMVLLAVDEPRWLGLIALVGVAVFVAQNLDNRDVVRAWADYQELKLKSVADIARLDPGRCRVYMANLHPEDADAYPELVARKPRPPDSSCSPRYEGYMVVGELERLEPVTNETIYQVCAGRSWEVLKATRALSFYGCRRFRRGRVGTEEIADVLRWDRLVPGQRLSERIHALPDQKLCDSAECMPLLRELRETYR
jgi:hypothetical protein